MNSHGQQIVRALLDVLNDPRGVDGGLISEGLLHGAVMHRTRPPATLAEFEDALNLCEREQWITSQRGKLGALRWAITDAGIVARRDM